MKHVIVGAGAAGISAAKTIREKRGDDEIVLISTDDAVHSRCMLHKFISGARSEKELSFIPDEFFEDRNITWLPGTTVTGIDTKNKRVQYNGGLESYDRLLIATGSENLIPPIGGLRDASNVLGLRNLSDAKAIRKLAADAGSIVIIGAGLVGLDATWALVEMGKKPVLVEMADTILAQNLDARAASTYKAKFEEAGCVFHIGRKVTDTVINESGAVTALLLDDGKSLPCDLVIVAAGVRPAVGFLENSGIACARSVTVDGRLATNLEGVYAAGDVAGLSGIWPNAVKQGEVAAMNMCGEETEYDDPFAIKNTVNFFGVVTLSVGQLVPTEGDEVLSREDRNRYERVIMRDGAPVGLILQGNISHSGIWQYLVKNKISLAAKPKPVWNLSFANFYGVEPNGEYKWVL